MTEVLAHYNRWRAWPIVAFLSIMLISIPFLTYIWFKKVEGGWQNHGYAISCVVTLWVAFIPIARSAFELARSLIADDARLIWIENGEMIWRNPKTFSLRCSDIENVVVGFEGEYGQFNSLVFRMRDGSSNAITPGATRENPDEIVKRLMEIIQS